MYTIVECDHNTCKNINNHNKQHQQCYNMIAVIVMITRLLIVSIVTATETMSRIKIMIGV